MSSTLNHGTLKWGFDNLVLMEMSSVVPMLHAIENDITFLLRIKFRFVEVIQMIVEK